MKINFPKDHNYLTCYWIVELNTRLNCARDFKRAIAITVMVVATPMAMEISEDSRKMQELIPVYEFSHVKYWDENQNPRCSDKSRLCWRFTNGGKYQFGDTCHFNHIRTERESVSLSVINVTGNGQMQQQKEMPWRTKQVDVD